MTSTEADIFWDELMVEDPTAAASSTRIPLAATGSGRCTPPAVEQATTALEEACLFEIAYWIGMLVGLLVGVVWLV